MVSLRGRGRVRVSIRGRGRVSVGIRGKGKGRGLIQARRQSKYFELYRLSQFSSDKLLVSFSYETVLMI